MSKEKKSSGFGKVLLAVLLSAGLTGGGFYYYTHHMTANATVAPQGSHEAALPARVTPEPIFFEMEPFTVTYHDTMGSRVLYVGLTIQLRDTESRNRLEKYLPVARSRVLVELGEIDPNQLTERQTKDKIRATVASVLNVPFEPETQTQAIADVLFSAFVIQ